MKLQIFFLLILAGFSSVYCQTLNAGISIEAGYSGTSKAENFTRGYEAPLDYYRPAEEYFPIKSDKDFSGGFSIGGEMYFELGRDYSLNAGLRYMDITETAAFTGFGGRLDINGEAESYCLNLGVKKKINAGLFFSPLVQLDLGFAFQDGSVKADFRDLDIRYNLNGEFSSHNLYLSPALGGLYDTGRLGIYLKSGYKFLLLDQNSNKDRYETSVDLSGFFIISGITLSLLSY